MKKVPCIRGLKEFEKKGCPRKPYDPETGEGCPAFIDIRLPFNENNKIVTKDQWNCIDILSIDLKLRELGLLETNSAAIESFRNGMVQTVNGRDIPKPDPALIELFKMYNHKKDVEEIEQKVRKEIEG